MKSSTKPNAEILAVLEAHGLNWQTFTTLRSDSYEKQLAKSSPESLDKFYSLLFLPGIPLELKAAQCPDWPAGTKQDGSKPTTRILSEVATRWNSERCLDVVGEVGKMIAKFRSKISGLPNSQMDNVTDSLCAMLSQEILAAKLEGKDLSQQTKALNQLLKKQKLQQSQQEINLARDKFEFDASKAALAAAATLKIISSNTKLSDVEKIQAARRALFGKLPEAKT